MLLVDFSDEDFFCLGPSRGERYLRDGPALVLPTCGPGHVALVVKPTQNEAFVWSSDVFLVCWMNVGRVPIQQRVSLSLSLRTPSPLFAPWFSLLALCSFSLLLLVHFHWSLYPVALLCSCFLVVVLLGYPAHHVGFDDGRLLHVGRHRQYSYQPPQLWFSVCCLSHVRKGHLQDWWRWRWRARPKNKRLDSESRKISRNRSPPKGDCNITSTTSRDSLINVMSEGPADSTAGATLLRGRGDEC